MFDGSGQQHQAQLGHEELHARDQTQPCCVDAFLSTPQPVHHHHHHHNDVRPKRRVIVFKPLREPSAHAAEPEPLRHQPANTKWEKVSTLAFSGHTTTEGSWRGRRITHHVEKQQARPSRDRDNSGNQSLRSPPEVSCQLDEKAWRHRFVRRWRKEQNTRCTCCHDVTCDDPWHAALQLLQAANVHPDLGMPPPDHDCYSAGCVSHMELEEDAQQLECSSEKTSLQTFLAEAASKARQLLKHQMNLVRI